MVNTYVLYHSPCHSGDGFAAAYAAWRKFGDNAETWSGDSVKFGSKSYEDSLQPSD